MTEFEQMELLGEDTMRAKLARGELKGEEARKAEIFVGMKQMERKAFSEGAVHAAHDQAASARTANGIALIALLFSLLATAISLAAFVTHP